MVIVNSILTNPPVIMYNIKEMEVSMNKDKTTIIILGALALIFSLCTFLMLINYNTVYYYLGDKFTTLSFFIFPVLALAVFVVSSIFIFKNNKISYVVPVAIALIGCILAFVLSNDASLSKIETDYLKNENKFNQQIVKIENKPEGLYELDNDDLKSVIPENKVLIVSVGNNKYAYFFIALDAKDRYEGYVYIPHGTPEEWDAFGAFTEPLDIEKCWFYMSLAK